MKKTKEDHILSEISRNAKTIEEYKKALQLNHIVYVEVEINHGVVVIPSCVYNKLTKAQRNKLIK